VDLSSAAKEKLMDALGIIRRSDEIAKWNRYGKVV
jgi:hypothetical protein